MRIFGAADVDGPAATAPGIGAALPILLTLEDRKHVSEGPTPRAVLRPSVVVRLRAAHPDHRVDAAAAADHVAEGHVEFAIVQPRRRVDGKVIVERPAHVVKPDARIHDGRCVVLSSRLDDEHLGAGRGQFSRQHRTGRACSHHDEVISPFFLRFVNHGELSGFRTDTVADRCAS